MTMFDSLKALLLPSALTQGSMDGKAIAPSATATDFFALLKGVDAPAIAPVTTDPQVQANGALPASDMEVSFPPNLVAPSPPTIARAAVDNAEIGQDMPATLAIEEADSADDDLSDKADASPDLDTALQVAPPIDGTVIGNLLMPPPTPPSVTPAASADPGIIKAKLDTAPQSAPVSATPASSAHATLVADTTASGNLAPAHAPLPASPFSTPDAMPSHAAAAPLKATIPASGKDEASPPPLPNVAIALVQGRPANGVFEKTAADPASLNVSLPLAIDRLSETIKPASITSLSGAAPVMASPAVSRPVASAGVPSAPVVPASMAEPTATSVVPTDATASQKGYALDNARPQAEATRLLHLVRSQMLNVRSSTGTADIAVEVPASSSRAPSGSHVLAAALPSSSAPAEFVSPQVVPITAPTSVAPLAVQVPVASVDLGGTIGAQIVDMGVSGQWIDGLARDIAGLSANGGHGRFQINSDQLGTVQVSVRQGAQGTDINLTVASEAAETALRQDSDRLRTDAALSAVRIADLKIERAPHITESARSDSAGSQGGSQQSSQNGNHANGQTPGQGLNQSAGQNNGQNGAQARSQGRENFTASHKGADESSVLNHSDSHDSGDAVRRRARYA